MRVAWSGSTLLSFHAAVYLSHSGKKKGVAVDLNLQSLLALWINHQGLVPNAALWLQIICLHAWQAWLLKMISDVLQVE